MTGLAGFDPNRIVGDLADWFTAGELADLAAVFAAGPDIAAGRAPTCTKIMSVEDGPWQILGELIAEARQHARKGIETVALTTEVL